MSNRDGTEPVQLTHFEGPFTSTPAWSPDGTRIAFVARGRTSVDVYVIDVTGGPPRQLTSAPSHERAPSWSRDGAWIYFGSNRSGGWNIWKVPSRGGAAQQVTSEGGIAPRESPDGQTLFYVKGNAPGIWRTPVAGGPERLVVEALQPYDWGNWAVTDEGIYYVRRDAQGPVLLLHAFASAAEQTIALLEPLPRHPAFALSPGGRDLFYTRVDRVDGDLLLVEDFE
jgi:dipeptidyl aminopeptidase/acylaminoacyl peptidase